MNILSLFDGISTGRYCLEQCGTPVENYVACEIDKYAIAVSKAHYPDIVQMGDVRGLSITFDVVTNTTHTRNLLTGKHISFKGKYDMIIGGSPCQGFSFAGKQLNFNDPRSILLFEYVDLLNCIKEQNPDVIFFLENVMMKQQFQDVISELLGVKPIKLNSALVCAQNRRRLYWTNIPYYGEPDDRGILLRDILETDGTGFVINRNERNERNDKAMCLDANYFKGADNHGQRTQIEQDNKSLCLSAGYANNPSICDYAKSQKQLIRIGNIYPSRGIAERIYSEQGKSPTLCTSTTGGNKMPKVGIVQKPRGFNKGGFYQEKSPSLTSNSWQENNKLLNGIHYRKLTVTECERLQGMPDGYTQRLIPAKKQISATQAYKMLGNGWQADTICFLFQPLADADIL